MKMLLTDRYEKIEIDSYNIYFSKFVIYRKNKSGLESIKKFYEDFKKNTHDFNMFMGSFKVIIFDISHEQYIFFTDNQGSRCFFFNTITSDFSDSFLKIRNNIPNYPAVAQFLLFGCIYDNDTVCKNIVRSDSEKYYIVSHKGMEEKDKGLHLIGKITNYESLQEILNVVNVATSNFKKVAILTGGVDSRAVFSNLKKINPSIHCVISGNESNIDVQIAKKITSLTKNTLLITPDDSFSEEMIEKIFVDTDGMIGILSAYRLLNKAYILKSEGYEMEFGGVAGELYKNSFINQDFPQYFGKINFSRFYKLKIAPFDLPCSLLGNKVQLHSKKMKEYLKILLINRCIDAKTKSQKTILMGYHIMKSRIVTISNAFSKIIETCSILMERDSVSLVYNKNPFLLEMQLFQRNEITKNLKSISKIKTDRNLTSSTNFLCLMSDLFKNYFFLLKIGFSRFFKRKKIVSQKEVAFKQGLESEHMKKSIIICKELGIIDQNAIYIPEIIADRVLTLGLIFKDEK